MKKILLCTIPASRNGINRFIILKLKLVLLLSVASQFYANASLVRDTTLDAEYRDCTILTVLEDLKTRTGYTFVYRQNDIADDVKISATFRNATLGDILDQVLMGSGYDYSIEGRVIAVNRSRASRQQPVTALLQITGRVVDNKGNPLPGATVVVHGTTQGTTADANGAYAIRVAADAVLIFSFVGYKSETLPVDGRTQLNVSLNPTAENIEEVTVVAFGEQTRESVVGSVTSINAADLRSSSSDLTTSFIGRIAGVIGYQQSGLPVALTEDEMSTKFFIRGVTSFQTNANTDPLIILDGVEVSKLDLARLSVEDIETFSILKDASATAMYGARGANGVFLVTTKKGVEGSVYTSAFYERVTSMPTREIDVVDPVDYMRYYNQAIMSRSSASTPRYSVERINRTASGKYPSWVYPANDWYDTMFDDHTTNYHSGVTVRGGSKIIQYYASVNYNFDSGMLKTDRLNQFDIDIKNNQVGFRTNFTIDLKAGIQFLITSSATMDRYRGPTIDAGTAYQLAFNVSPVDFAPTYPADEKFGWPHIRFGIGEGGTSEGTNPYAQLQRGYKQDTRFSTINRAEYIQNLSSLVKGLELRLSASLVQESYGSQQFTTFPFYYYMSKYDQETGKHTLVENPGIMGGNQGASTTLRTNGNSTSSSTRITYEGRLYHNAVWGDHQTSVTGVMQLYERVFSPISSVLNGMPNRNLSYSGRVSYGYKNRYFLEGSFAFNGSERFAEGNRMGFFPSIGGSWVASKEEWMQPLSDVISFLKFRASWGKVGNDGVISTPRYVYLPEIGGVEYNGLRDLVPNPQSSGYTRKQIVAYANEGIQWEIAEMMNLGIDATLAGGLLEFQADFFRQKRHNIISQRMNVPAHLGIEVPPLDNVGRVLSRGVDLSVKAQHRFSRDLGVILNGTLTYSKATYDYIEEAVDKPSWQRKKGHEISQQMGYIAEGLFRDQAEIDNSPRQDGNVMPGDIRYRDINSDGVIDVEDAVFIGYPEMPRLVYGFSGIVYWRSLELNFAFQGSGKRSFFIDPVSLSPFVGNHAMLQAIADNHWSESNMDRHAFWPRLSTSSIAHHNPYENWYDSNNAEVRKSTYFMMECWFLRCRAISLTWNLPKKWLDKVGMQSAKLTLSTNNPFMITDFKLWDVELGENGFNYPIQRTYSVGVNFSF